ncbi:acetoacetyl-CoA synthetase [Reticulibacter mediterranei]|uniref:Acetoacetyl-CoA synthetase n=1 Tax=Reticulibacter mediterranei TaxID=2778369 RepID=A0A8J3II75_9CHLR|nr:acetoacetate--CoA ligase [Reticulibacter mediterranei]GHO95021.1 acetoacetyl-CoA synthetase [Reticulibacter mediterranei]
MVTSSGNVRPLWEPSEELQQQANVTQYMQWLATEKGLHFHSRAELWAWSVTKIEDFWASIWEYFHIQASHPYTAVLAERKMPGATWFPGAELNFAEHIFRNATTERPALLFRSERHALVEVSWEELSQKVGAIASALRAAGIERGDRVVAYMPNIPETLIAFLACASIGAIWSSCSPDFGTSSVIDRFKQIEPKVLFAVDGYQYGGKTFDRRAIVAELQQALPTVQKTVLFPYLLGEVEPIPESLQRTVTWSDMLKNPASLRFEQVPFDHPLWVLYSSGTTGLPKAIVQGHGGILIEHLKSLALDFNIKPNDRFFWFTTTGWMMWNLLLSCLLVGGVMLLYDGSPAYPDSGALWKFAQDTHMTFFGTSAAYIATCMKAGIEPGSTYDLSALRGLGSTGSPLPPEGFQWIYEHVRHDIWLASVSGGTDVCAAFVGGCVLLPVHLGELQCRALGAKVDAFDEQGQPLIDEVGELVITEPMPSMPLFFWNDPNGERYQESYFNMYPGIWRHGDWIKITPRGSAIIYGRSDSTINRMGIRMGSSEIYRVVEGLPEVLDSLMVGVEQPGGKYYMPLFVVLRENVQLDDELKAKIKARLRNNVSPHHVPDEIIAIPDVPRTLSGKKLEVPIKKLFMGVPVEKAVSRGALGNPQSLQFFVEFVNKIPH